MPERQAPSYQLKPASEVRWSLHRPRGVPGDAGSTNNIEGGFAVEGGRTPQLVEGAGPGCAKRPFDSESTGTTASWSPAIPAWEEVVYE